MAKAPERQPLTGGEPSPSDRSSIAGSERGLTRIKSFDPENREEMETFFGEYLEKVGLWLDRKNDPFPDDFKNDVRAFFQKLHKKVLRQY